MFFEPFQREIGNHSYPGLYHSWGVCYGTRLCVLHVGKNASHDQFMVFFCFHEDRSTLGSTELVVPVFSILSGFCRIFKADMLEIFLLLGFSPVYFKLCGLHQFHVVVNEPSGKEIEVFCGLWIEINSGSSLTIQFAME